MPQTSNLPQINHPVAAMAANQLFKEHTKANENKERKEKTEN